MVSSAWTLEVRRPRSEGRKKAEQSEPRNSESAFEKPFKPRFLVLVLGFSNAFEDENENEDDRNCDFFGFRTSAFFPPSEFGFLVSIGV